jgi:hypothetical protein
MRRTASVDRHDERRRARADAEWGGTPAALRTSGAPGTISQVTSRPAAAQHVGDLELLRRVRDQQSLHRAGRCAAQHLPAPRGARDGGDAPVRGETGDQTDQESRSAGHEPHLA